MLTLILGPMFSGKTTSLVHRADAASYTGKVLFIVHASDTRNPETIISTHNDNLQLGQRRFDVRRSSDLSDFNDDVLQQYTTVCIDEAQFFKSIVSSVVHMTDDLRLDVIVAGLNGRAVRKPFDSDFLNIIPHVDEIVFLNNTVYCQRCVGKKTHAIFTHELAKTGQNVIGGAGTYIPVCRDCWVELNK